MKFRKSKRRKRRFYQRSPVYFQNETAPLYCNHLLCVLFCNRNHESLCNDSWGIIKCRLADKREYRQGYYFLPVHQRNCHIPERISGRCLRQKKVERDSLLYFGRRYFHVPVGCEIRLESVSDRYRLRIIYRRTVVNKRHTLYYASRRIDADKSALVGYRSDVALRRRRYGFQPEHRSFRCKADWCR